jgi:hypothetical protein
MHSNEVPDRVSSEKQECVVAEYLECRNLPSTLSWRCDRADVRE